MLRLGKSFSTGAAAAAAAVLYVNRKASTTCCEPRASLPVPTWPPATTKNPKRAIVVGAGIAGICSAYELSSRGYQVLVLDSAAGPGTECSAVAAGGMQRSNPVVDRAKWKAIVSNLLARSDQFRYFYIQWTNVFSDPHFLRWGWEFAFNSLVQPARLLYQQDQMLSFTKWAIDLFEQDPALKAITQEALIESRGGMMLNQTTQSAHCHEPNTFRLDSSSSIQKQEPFVQQWNPDSTDAMVQPHAVNGNSEIFTQSLAQHLAQTQQVVFCYNAQVESFGYENGRVTRIDLSDSTSLALDHQTDLVVAAGAWTPHLLWHLDEYVPIYPLKGYCIQIPNEQKSKVQGILSDGVTFFSKIGTHLRIVGVGEFAGWNTKPTAKVDAAFRTYVANTGLEIEGIPTRCGLRPMSADGAVIAGKLAGWDNVAINTGPGSNGWKIALGAAKVLVNSMDNNTSNDNQLPFDSNVLLPNGRVKPTLVWSKFCLWRHSFDN